MLGSVVTACGIANDARSTVVAALETIGRDHDVVAAGIDAPLFRGSSGGRQVDVLIRRAIKEAGREFVRRVVTDPEITQRLVAAR